MIFSFFLYLKSNFAATGKAEAEEAGGTGQVRLRPGAHGGTPQRRIFSYGDHHHLSLVDCPTQLFVE